MLWRRSRSRRRRRSVSKLVDAQPRAHEPIAEVLGHPLELGRVRRHRAAPGAVPRGPCPGPPRCGEARPGTARAARSRRPRSPRRGSPAVTRRAPGSAGDPGPPGRFRSRSAATAHDPVGSQVDQARPLGVEDEAMPFAHARVLAEPLERAVAATRPGPRTRAGTREGRAAPRASARPVAPLAPTQRRGSRPRPAEASAAAGDPPRGTAPRGAGGGGGELGPERGVLGEDGLLRSDRGRP